MAVFQLAPSEQKCLPLPSVLGAEKLNLKEYNKDAALFNETYLSLPVAAPPDACSATSQQPSSRTTAYFSSNPQHKKSLYGPSVHLERLEFIYLKKKKALGASNLKLKALIWNWYIYPGL